MPCFSIYTCPPHSSWHPMSVDGFHRLLTWCHPEDGDTWWRHQMETFSALLAICAGNSPVPSEFTAQRPVTRSFDVFFDLRLNKRLSKQSRGWWFETLSHPLWRHRSACALSAFPPGTSKPNGRHFQMHILVRRCLDLMQNFIEIFSYSLTKSSLSKLDILYVYWWASWI